MRCLFYSLPSSHSSVMHLNLQVLWTVYRKYSTLDFTLGRLDLHWHCFIVCLKSESPPICLPAAANAGWVHNLSPFCPTNIWGTCNSGRHTCRTSQDKSLR
ncbi:hypothetical protein GIB67_007091 [Kingdonia uniflora]|uniref:Uncharacterized protein n=1 Tax=Kingdonia uniflora TaxID=39325 RepID=A0A7J7P078_9MAGN|nr:hypothetical protein GIB67_007091 [Kingdonia uniflora]